VSRTKGTSPGDCLNPDCTSGIGGDPLTGYCGTCLMQLPPFARVVIESRMEQEAAGIEDRAPVTPGWGSQ
jgi:hypothetical protein